MQTSRRSSSPGRPASSAATSSRSCCAAATASSASTTTRSTARSRSPTTTTRDYHFVEGDARDVDLMTELLVGLRPLHRRCRADRRHLVLPRLRLRPARHQRADHGVASATPRSRRTAAGRLQKVTYLSSSMVFESTEHWPSHGGRRARDPAAAVVLRLPEAGGRVLRPGRLGPVRAAVHDRAAVQLRRHRRGPGARRRRGRSRQRQAGDEPRRARPGAEDRQGSGPAAHPRRRQPGAALHLRRRPRRAASSTAMEHPAALNDDFNLSTAGVDDACSSWPR